MTYKHTIDHSEIVQWVGSHGGYPAAIRSTDGELGIVRLQFPEQELTTSRLHEISWDEFFQEFETRRLAFVFDDDESDAYSKIDSAKLVKRRLS